MSPDEIEIVEFLRKFRRNFVSVNEISRSIGQRKRYLEDRHWARPLLRRMEVDGLVESNEFSEYRLLLQEEDTTSFWKAVTNPSLSLGDTTIIELDEDTDTDTGAVKLNATE